MSGNKIAESILKSKKVTPYDYLDITDENDVISFVSTTKMEDVISKIEKSWEVTYNEKFLSHSDKNKKIFKELGYVIKGEKPTRPDVGIKGKIVREYTSKKTGNTFCLFKNANIEVPINKSYLKDATNLSFFWEKNRNKIKVGRLIRALSTHMKIALTDKLVEDFVNQFKTIYDIEKDALKKFDIASGSDIPKWYKRDNYVKGCVGQLANSCMKNVPSKYFNFYKDNEVKMLVLYSDGGKITKDKYMAETIKGRALIWENCSLGDLTVTFLDRIYTHRDSDIELFREYARSKGWYWRDNNGRFTNGKVIVESNRLKYKLGKVNFRNYPYVDTLCYIDKNTKHAHFSPSDGCDMILRRTDGSYSRG